MGLLGTLASKGIKAGSAVANAPASGSVVGEIGNDFGGGVAASAAGTAADIAIDGAAGALSKTGTLASGLRGGIYGHAAFSAGNILGQRMGGHRIDDDAEKENRERAGQTTLENFKEFALDPGRTVDRLQTGARKMVGEIGDAYDSHQKTKQMETNRRLSRPMSEGYKSNVNQLQGLLGR